MNMTIRDSQEAFEAGRREWEAFSQEFEMMFYAPKILEDLVQQINSVPEEMIATLPPDLQVVARQLRGGK